MKPRLQLTKLSKKSQQNNQNMRLEIGVERIELISKIVIMEGYAAKNEQVTRIGLVAGAS